MKIKELLNQYKKVPVLFTTFVFFVFPASGTYQLKGYEFGGGGGTGSSSNYSVEGQTGQTSGQQTGTTYNANSGLLYVQEANTPTAPTLSNTGNWYNKLFFQISTANNPTDATYLIAITSDNWATTHYLNTDNTIGGTTYTLSNFQTYTAWGGGSGGYIIGLQPSTTYKIKVKARQGSYTEGPLGPEASATTSGTSLTFDIDIASTDQETSAPYSLDVGNLTSGSVVTATNKIWIDLDTNAQYGGQVFISDANNGLKSATTNYTITSSTTNLTSVTNGFGLVGDTVTQNSGGPLVFQSPYNSGSNNVGVVDTSLRLILASSTAVTAGRASILVKAKASETIPAATDYADLFTVIAAGAF
jgi:hypothetical protein